MSRAFCIAKWPNLRAEKRLAQLEAMVKRQRLENDHNFYLHLCNLCEIDLKRKRSADESAKTVPHILHLLYLSASRLKGEAQTYFLNLLREAGYSPYESRRKQNPEVSKIMQDRGVTRQRAHQIIKARQKSQEQDK